MYFLALLLAVLPNPQFAERLPAPADDFSNVAAIELALCLQADAPALPGPAPAKCARCNGTGVITQGDGHQTPCPLCSQGQTGLTLYIPASATISDQATPPDPDPSPCANGRCPAPVRDVSSCAGGQCSTSRQQQATTNKRVMFTRRGLLFRWLR